MTEPSEFIREYFLQTRKEIDTEKRERDHLLNFAVIVLGALGFAIFESETSQEFLQKPEALAIEIPALIIISSLFWIRYKKLKQISDRWFVLYYIARRHFGDDGVNRMLEGVVEKGFRRRRYIIKDFILNIALNFPVYGLLVLQFMRAHYCSERWRMYTVVVVIILHFFVSSIILGRKISDPLL